MSLTLDFSRYFDRNQLLEQPQTAEMDFVKYPCPGPVCPPNIQRTHDDISNECLPCLARRKASIFEEVRRLESVAQGTLTQWLRQP